MKNLTWQNPEQLFVAQELINKVKSKCCGIKGEEFHQWIAPQLKEYYDRLERILGKEQIKLTDKLLKDLQHAIETY